MTPDELRALLGNVDWNLMFLGEPPYRQREFRRKEDRRQFPMGIEAGLKDGFRLPSGLDPAHQVGLLLSYIAFPYTSELSFDELPTPFRAVATNMDAATVRVLDRGSLAQALLATMALPGIFPPVQSDGATLADGGMLNNVPADVVRAMGADIVIAIDVSDRETDEHIDALGQAGRAIDVMMENATRRALVDADLVIRPDLEGFGSLDWRRSDALADRGYAAAEAVSDELLQYTVSEAEWDAWRRARGARTRDKAFVPTSLRVRGTTPALEELILERLDPYLDQPLDFEALGEALTWVTGSDRFDSVRYEVTGDDGLLIVAREKSNGPPFLRFGLDISNEALDMAVGFKARLIALDVGKPDAEVRADVSVGTVLGAGVEGEFNWSSQHLDDEVLRCRNGNGDGQTGRVGLRCVRLVGRRQRGVRSSNGSGRRSRGGCRVRMPLCPVACRRPWVVVGSVRAVVCRRSAWRPDRLATCPWRSGKRSRSCERRAPGCVTLPVGSGEPRRLSRESYVATRRLGAAVWRIGRRLRSGTAPDVPSARR